MPALDRAPQDPELDPPARENRSDRREEASPSLLDTTALLLDSLAEARIDAARISIGPREAGGERVIGDGRLEVRPALDPKRLDDQLGLQVTIQDGEGTQTLTIAPPARPAIDRRPAWELDDEGWYESELRPALSHFAERFGVTLDDSALTPRPLYQDRGVKHTPASVEAAGTSDAEIWEELATKEAAQRQELLNEFEQRLTEERARIRTEFERRLEAERSEQQRTLGGLEEKLSALRRRVAELELDLEWQRPIDASVAPPHRGPAAGPRVSWDRERSPRPESESVSRPLVDQLLELRRVLTDEAESGLREDSAAAAQRRELAAMVRDFEVRIANLRALIQESWRDRPAKAAEAQATARQLEGEMAEARVALAELDRRKEGNQQLRGDIDALDAAIAIAKRYEDPETKDLDAAS